MYNVAKSNIEYRVDNSDNRYIFTRLRSKISLVSNRILNEEDSDIKYIVIRNEYTNNGKYSVRSREKDNFDVTVLAEKWSGGGHLAASGFLLNDEHDRLFIDSKMHLL